MKKMRNQMIPLTVANTLDQSVKERIEAQSQQTVKQAVESAKMAPQGQFDVFDALGKVVSQQKVDNFRDQTIYVGVQKVAGGALRFDEDDWDGGIDLDDIDQPIRKVVTFVRDGGVREDIEPQGDETLIQLAERMGYGTKDGTPIEVKDAGNNDDVSNRRARDMVGCAFRVNLKAIKGGGFMGNKIKAHPSIVSKEIIDQTTAFTSNRGRLEMGGLLIGHVDEQGRNVVVAGFFPEQTEASPGYCEFEGGFAAMAAGACDFANERCGGPHSPNIRIIGWIHTHPDIGIFLSGIDVKTFKNLREMSGDGRCVAVVVDPLRKEHGVFRSPLHAENKDAETADGKIRLSEDMEARYHKFLDRMRFMQLKNGKTRLPFIMSGILRRDRISMGDFDDIEDARADALYKSQKNIESLKNQTANRFMEQKASLQRELQSITKDLRGSLQLKEREFRDALKAHDSHSKQEFNTIREKLVEDRTVINSNTKNYQNLEKLMKERQQITDNSFSEMQKKVESLEEKSSLKDEKIKFLEDKLKSRTEVLLEHQNKVEERLKEFEKVIKTERAVLMPVAAHRQRSKDETSSDNLNHENLLEEVPA